MEIFSLTDIRIVAFYGLTLVVLVLVPVFGGKPERYSILVMFSSLIVQTLLHSLYGLAHFDEVDWIMVFADTWILIGIGGVALNANRFWPIIASAMALLSLASHFARHNTEMLGFSYAQFNFVPTAVILLLMFLGMIGHRLRLRSNGEDLDWVPFKEYAKLRRIANKAEL